MPVLTTARLRLRPRTLDDLPFLVELNADPRVMRYIGDGSTLDAASVEARFRANLRDREINLVREPWDDFLLIERKSDGAKLGMAGIVRCEIDGARDVEIGWWLTPSAWGSGYATEAALAVRDYAFGEVGLSSLSVVLQPENVKSAAVAQRIGGELVGRCEYRGKQVTRYLVRRSR